MAQFLDELSADFVTEEGPRPVWRLRTMFRYISGLSDEYGRWIGMIVVPAGFESDMASVPRLPVAWLLAGGKGNKAAVVHDYLCVKKRYTSTIAARIFAEALAASGVSLWRRALMYAAVRYFGPKW